MIRTSSASSGSVRPGGSQDAPVGFQERNVEFLGLGRDQSRQLEVTANVGHVRELGIRSRMDRGREF